jgi:hypothetical protein
MNSKQFSVEDYRKSGKDLLAEQAFLDPNGPALKHFQGKLPPLASVNLPMKAYPIPVALPGCSSCFQVAADGAYLGINVNIKNGFTGENGYDCWYAPKHLYKVWIDGNFFGSDMPEFDPPTLKDDCLPIYTIKAKDKTGTTTFRTFALKIDSVDQEQFLACSWQRDGEPVTLSIESLPHQCKFKEALLVDTFGRVQAIAGGNVSINEKALKWQLADGETASLLIPQDPFLPVANLVSRNEKQVPLCRHNLDREAVNNHITTWFSHLVTADGFSALESQAQRFWSELLYTGSLPDIPEPIVENALKTVTLTTHILRDGDQMMYSKGSQYQRQYTRESTVGSIALAQYGYMKQCRQAIQAMLAFYQAGIAAYDIGNKLQLSTEYIRLSDDKNFYKLNRPLYRQWMERIFSSRQQNQHGLLPKERISGDIGFMVHALYSNTSAWRGVTEMAQLMAEYHEPDALAYLEQAHAFRQTILKAALENEDKSTGYSFVPNALYVDEDNVSVMGQDDQLNADHSRVQKNFGPYKLVTENTVASYWNLLMPDVVGSGVFAGNPLEDRILEYMRNCGSFLAGLIKCRIYKDYTSLKFLLDMDIDDGYSLPYILACIRRGEWKHALVTLYGKLALGFTENTYMSGEISSLEVRPGRAGRDTLLPPTSFGNALFLTGLRNIIITEQSTTNDCRYDTLSLCSAIPPAWLREGKELRLKQIPSFFGKINLHIKAKKNSVEVSGSFPESSKNKRILLNLRREQQHEMSGATAGKWNTEKQVLDLSDVPRGKEFKVTLNT